MNDITREAALKRIQHLFNTDRWDFVCSIDKDAIRLAYKALENQKTGHWIKQHIGQITTYKCSECGRIVKDDTGYDVTKDYPYCNCGAKMEGENNE